LSTVAFYYNGAEAQRAKEEFDRVFSQKKLPQDMPAYRALSKEVDLIEVLYQAKIVSSKNDARRLLASGSIFLLDKDNPGSSISIKEPIFSNNTKEAIFKIGKKRFLRVISK